MKKLAIRIAFISLVLFVSVPIFKTQINIRNMSKQTKKLDEQIAYVSDKVDYTKEKLELIKSGDKAVLSEYARSDFDYYDQDEELIYNDIAD